MKHFHSPMNFTIPYTFESYSETQGDWEMELEVDFSYDAWTEYLPYGSTYVEDPHFEFEITDVRRTDGRPFDEIPERHQNIKEYLCSYLKDDDDFLKAAAKHVKSRQDDY